MKITTFYCLAKYFSNASNMQKVLQVNKHVLSYKKYSTFLKLDQEVVFSGIQPTGIPHIGNYLGAIKQWVKLQERDSVVLYSIVDLHSITIPKDRETLKQNILDMASCLLACGIDPNKSIVFQQSVIPEHALLSWVLGCQTPMNRLNHFPQWQERLLGSKHGGYLGTFSYPTLQAADILLYKATHVPAGDDQKCHLELCQELASSFNSAFKVIFPKTLQLSEKTCSRIRNLRQPDVKMSKSAPSELSRVGLTDSNDQIWLKIKKSVTDSTSTVTYNPDCRPGVSNLIEIHSGFTGQTTEEICDKARDLNTGQYKWTVAEAVIEVLSPIRERYAYFLKNEKIVKQTLSDGAEKAREIAAKTWMDVRMAMGMEL